MLSASNTQLSARNWARHARATAIHGGRRYKQRGLHLYYNVYRGRIQECVCKYTPKPGYEHDGWAHVPDQFLMRNPKYLKLSNNVSYDGSVGGSQGHICVHHAQMRRHALNCCHDRSLRRLQSPRRTCGQRNVMLLGCNTMGSHSDIIFKEARTTRVCLEAVRRDGAALLLVPDEKRTKEDAHVRHMFWRQCGPVASRMITCLWNYARHAFL